MRRSERETAAPLMSKFPARQPAANRKATRLRENQRRHRARIKARTADLEARLAETEARLDAALDEVAFLASQVELLRSGETTSAKQLNGRADPDPNLDLDSYINDGTVRTAHPQPRPPPRAVSLEPASNGGANQPSRSSGEPASASDNSSESLIAEEGASSGEPAMLRALAASCPAAAATASLPGRSPQPPGQPAHNGSALAVRPDYRPETSCGGRGTGAISAATQPDRLLIMMMSGKGCAGLPAPRPGESTIPCVDAYAVVDQQNFAGLGRGAVTRWLEPGFRRAAKDKGEQGAGCRVDTQLLFTLLDHVTSSDGQDRHGYGNGRLARAPATTLPGREAV